MFCQVLAPNNRCAGCGQPGRLRDHVDREVADLPIVGHPTRLHIAVPRYVCVNPDCDPSRGFRRAQIVSASSGLRVRSRS